MATCLLLEVILSLQECVGARLVFAIRSSEVFTLGGDLLYIFYGSCWGAFGKFAGGRLFARQRVCF